MFSKDSVVGVECFFKSGIIILLYHVLLLYLLFLLFTVAKLLGCSLFRVLIMWDIITSFIFEKCFSTPGEVDSPGSLKSFYISYHRLVRNTTKLNIYVKKQKYFQNLSSVVEFVVFQHDCVGSSSFHRALLLARILRCFCLTWGQISISASKLSNYLVSKVFKSMDLLQLSWKLLFWVRLMRVRSIKILL